MSASLKQRNELYAFERLVEIAQLDADLSSVRQLAPPNPDIICKVSGVDRGFELTSITDPSLEQQFGTGNFRYTNYRIEISDVVGCLKRKSHKKYCIPGVELIIHEAATPIDDLWLLDRSILDLAVQAETDRSPFAKVWILDIASGKACAYTSKIFRRSAIEHL